MLTSVRDLLVPPRCAACYRRGAPGLCGPCLELAVPAANLGWRLLSPGVAAVGLFTYGGPVQDALRAVKVGGHHEAAVSLGALLRARIPVPPPAPGLAWTWVPSTPRRVRQRGADVARLLAGPRARPLLRRIVDVPDQTELDRAGRRLGPVGSFAVTGPVASRVVLIDDIRTTGATATAAAQELRRGGARRVLVVTLAIA